MLQFKFDAEVIHWRGPSPYFFAPIPMQHSAQISQVSKLVTYGWGMIPVEAAIGAVVFRTSLFPKDQNYLLPLKDVVRRKANITAGDSISVDMKVRAVER
jgi:Domain of unknown function (DUF1905)